MAIQTARNLGLATVAAVLSLTPAFATNVSYSTSGTFSNCTGYFTCAGSVIDGNATGTGTGATTLTITYTPVTEQFPNVTAPPPTYAQFGLFTVAGGSSTNTKAGSATFTLDITQELPLPGGIETFSDTISGVVKTGSTGSLQVVFTSGNGTSPVSVGSDPLTFNPTPALTFYLGDVEYWVDEGTPFVPSTAGNKTAISGAIDSPEPSLYAVTAFGLLGLIAVAVRRKKQFVA